MNSRVLIMLVAVACLAGCAGQKNPEAENAAVAAAESWLKLVDEQKYDESWQESASIFRAAVPQERWNSMTKAIRGPMGKLLSREPKSTRYRTSLPGAPDGEYVIIQFRASFDNKQTAIETVTPMKEKDGSWRVTGYYIK